MKKYLMGLSIFIFCASAYGEVIDLGEKNIYPTFKSYLAIKENIILASLLTITNQTLANAMDKTKEANDGK